MDEQNNKLDAEALVKKIKALVKEGNITRILIKQGDRTILNLPLTAGIAGTVIGIAAGPWALLTATIAALGFDCKIELIKKDGSSMELLSRDVGRKAASVGSRLLSRLADDHKDE